MDKSILLSQKMAKGDGSIICRVKVNRLQTAQEALEATGCKLSADKEVVKAMPRGEGEEVEVVFFKFGARLVSPKEQERGYARRGLVPDPRALAAVNQADPTFADKHQNLTQWMGKDGQWHHATFSQLNGERCVRVGRGTFFWYVFWWFAGSRKVSEPLAEPCSQVSGPAHQ
jgi:hypothetical protein